MSEFPVVTEETLRRFDVAGPRYTSYPTAPEWSDEFGPDDYGRALAAAALRVDEPLSIYVHIPFCREMCTYCGCHVIVARSPQKMDRYLDVVDREIALVAGRLGARRTVSRVHLGGGTPTALDEAQLGRLAGALRGAFTVLPGAELAVEIDPVVTRRAQLEVLARAGWNRISMGVQDFDPGVQQAVNRVQTVEVTRAMIDGARELGYRSVNLDLIYGLPRQTPDSWRRTLEQIVALRPDRLALFSFAYVPSVKPHQKALETVSMPSPTGKLALFRLAHDLLTGAGYRWVGMDHFALPDDELARAAGERRLWRDFQGYTTLRAADTVALGVSGIGKIGGCYAQNVKTLPPHEALLAEGRLPIERGHWLTEDDQLRSDAITQIMCNFWVDLGPDAAGRWARELEALRAHERDGLVTLAGATVTLTPLGRVFVRNVAMVFDAYLGRGKSAQRPTFSRTV